MKSEKSEFSADIIVNLVAKEIDQASSTEKGPANNLIEDPTISDNRIIPEKHNTVFEVPNEQNWNELIDQNTVRHNFDYSESQYGLDRVEETGENSDIIIGDGLTVITAKPKTEKTKLSYIFAAAFLCTFYNKTFASAFAKDQRDVLYIDTEQSKSDTSRGYKILQKLVRTSGDIRHFRMLALRSFNYKERIFLLLKFIYAHLQYGVIIIDGVRDLISDPNSAEEANNVVSSLLKIATERNIAVVVIIHQNKIDNNVRGHIGTELMNKAHVVMAIEKEDDTCIVRPIVSRNRPFSPFAFKITGDDGVPELVENFSEDNEVKQKPAIENFPLEVHKELIKEAISNTKINPGWSDLKSALRIAFANRGKDVGDTKMREVIAHYLKIGVLTKEPIDGRSYDAYRFQER